MSEVQVGNFLILKNVKNNIQIMNDSERLAWILAGPIPMDLKVPDLSGVRIAARVEAELDEAMRLYGVELMQAPADNCDRHIPPGTV